MKSISPKILNQNSVASGFLAQPSSPIPLWRPPEIKWNNCEHKMWPCSVSLRVLILSRLRFSWRWLGRWPWSMPLPSWILNDCPWGCLGPVALGKLSLKISNLVIGYFVREGLISLQSCFEWRNHNNYSFFITLYLEVFEVTLSIVYFSFGSLHLISALPCVSSFNITHIVKFCDVNILYICAVKTVNSSFSYQTMIRVQIMTDILNTELWNHFHTACLKLTLKCSLSGQWIHREPMKQEITIGHACSRATTYYFISVSILSYILERCCESPICFAVITDIYWHYNTTLVGCCVCCANWRNRAEIESSHCTATALSVHHK
jgi:hypothetical protein